jgi:DsbC/DsbD-like thiol-disulfide interchange protein
MISAAKIAPAASASIAQMTAPIARCIPLRRHVFQAAIVMSLAAIPSASAQDASNWDGQVHSAARLIAGAMSKNHDAAFLRAGIEIRLDPGWLTYWRDPGDSGAPPTFDFSGSENVKSVNVLWPAPERIPDGAGGNSIGYRSHVILPLHVVPMDDAKQTALRLKLQYDVCSNICIPVESNLVLNLSGDGAEEAAIARAEIRVPRPVALKRRVSAPKPVKLRRRKVPTGTGRLSPFSACIVSRATRMIASSSMLRRRPERRSTCSSKALRPIGRCRCHNKARPTGPSGTSNSSSRVCRRMPRPKARR